MIQRLCLAVLLLGLACAPTPEPEVASEPVRHELRGEILQLRPGETNAAVISHQEIPGWMDAMTMTFPVPDEAEFVKLHEGDYVHAEVVVSRGLFHLENIEIVEAPPEPDEE